MIALKEKIEISSLRYFFAMFPKVIVFNSISIDGSVKDFNVDIGLHYDVLGKIGADSLLVGSNTARTGIEQFYKTTPPEDPNDFIKPKVESDDKRLIWVIADSRGLLQGLLHVLRRSGYAKEIIVLVSKLTPKTYLAYLSDRNYDYIVAGNDHVDLQVALNELANLFGIKVIVTDSGGVLVNNLLDLGLVHEINVLIAPQIVGKQAMNLFRTLERPIQLELSRVENLGSYAFLAYTVNK